MSQPYVGEIRMFGGNFAPAGWAFCDGSLQPISEYETLFNLIGTTYGGDGQSTFALPDLRGRVPIHQGQGPGITQNYIIGQLAGAETVTLTTNQIPSHNHTFMVSTTPPSLTSPNNSVVGSNATIPVFHTLAPVAQMNASSIQPSGGSQPHDNMMPFLAVTFIISFFGIYPSQN